jgi:hypothetical protein
MSTDSCPIKVVNTAPSNTTSTDENANETAKTGKVTAIIAVMSIFCRKKCNLQSANPGNEKPSCHNTETAEFLKRHSHKPRDLSQKMRKGQILKKVAHKPKKVELNSTNLILNYKKGTLGEIYLLLTFGFQITTCRIFYLFVSHLHI